MSEHPIELLVNGVPRAGRVEARRTLADGNKAFLSPTSSMS